MRTRDGVLPKNGIRTPIGDAQRELADPSHWSLTTIAGPLIAFHSKKPSTGTMQRRMRYASRKVGRSRTGLVLSIDRFAATCRVLAPIRDEAPAQRVQRHLASLMIATDDE